MIRCEEIAGHPDFRRLDSIEAAVVLEPGKGVWGIEFDPGKVMDGDAEEHIVEAASVLSRYCDLIAMRAFPGFKNWQYDRDDPLIKTLARHARVPVMSCAAPAPSVRCDTPVNPAAVTIARSSGRGAR